MKYDEDWMLRKTAKSSSMIAASSLKNYHSCEQETLCTWRPFLVARNGYPARLLNPTKTPGHMSSKLKTDATEEIERICAVDDTYRPLVKIGQCL